MCLFLCSVFKTSTLVQYVSQFYFKNGRPPPKDLKEQCLSRIDHLFFGGEGLQIQGKCF
jgi:hypothetical protein